MKISLSLLALFAVALSLSACNTLANRRTLYAPKKGDGYWTHTLDDGSWRKRGTDQDTRVRTKSGNASVEAVAPIPPPPPAPLPEVAPSAL